MKTINSIIAILFFLPIVAFSQKNWEMDLTNFVQEDERGFTFDVKIRNTNPAQPIGISAIQIQIDFNAALKNGGFFQTSQLNYVTGTTEMNGAQCTPGNLTVIGASLNRFQWVSGSLDLNRLTTYLNDGNWRRIGTFRARLRTASTGTTALNFADVLVSMAFVSSGCKVFDCAVTYDPTGDGEYIGNEGPGWYRTGAASTEITSKTLTNSISSAQVVAGHYMSTGTDWATPSNWNNLITGIPASYHTVPTSGQNALIGVNAVIAPSTQASVNNLIMKPSTSLTIQSSASGTGSLIHSNTGVAATVQRYLPGSAAAWHMVSAPVSGMAITASDWAPAADEDLYIWLEETPGTWVNYKNTTVAPTFPATNGGDNFAPGRGYLVDYNQANPVNVFSGTLNAGTHNINLEKNPAKWSWQAGWNLIGNPYASSLNFTQTLADNAGDLAEGYAQVYNPNKEGGAGYALVTSIAPGQGFFVLANTDGAVFSLTTAQQTHGGSFLKNTLFADELRIRLSYGQAFDETSLILNQDAVADHDFWDATKMFSFDQNIPQIYTSTQGNWPLAVNSLPQPEAQDEIPLSVRIPEDGLFSISLSMASGGFANKNIILKDLFTGTSHQLNQSSYQFVANASDDPDRFLIAFGTVGIEKISENKLIAYQSNKNIRIINLPEDALVSVFDLGGKILFKNNYSADRNLTIPLELNQGVYVVNVINKAGNKTAKVIIN